MSFVYGIAKAIGARLLLRIEDHDQGRSRQEYEDAIFADLAWLGFRFDDHPVPGKPHPLRQSNRTSRYEEIINLWTEKGLAYPCTCTRAQIQLASTRAGNIGDELYYPGTCRSGPGSPLVNGYGQRAILPEQRFQFEDAICGPQSQIPAHQCGDVLLRDRHHNFTYQFAVAVDDLDQNVNLIIRGEDILHATGRQIYLGTLLGRSEPATFAHHPLICDDKGQKLGKRFFSEAIAKKRADGESPEALLGTAVHSVGLSQTAKPIAAADLASLFHIEWT